MIRFIVELAGPLQLSKLVPSTGHPGCLKHFKATVNKRRPWCFCFMLLLTTQVSAFSNLAGPVQLTQPFAVLGILKAVGY